MNRLLATFQCIIIVISLTIHGQSSNNELQQQQQQTHKHIVNMDETISVIDKSQNLLAALTLKRLNLTQNSLQQRNIAFNSSSLIPTTNKLSPPVKPSANQKLVETQLKVVDLRIHQLETLHGLLATCLKSIQKVSATNPEFGVETTAADLQAAISNIKNQNKDFMSALLEVSFTASSDYKSTVETEKSVRKSNKQSSASASSKDSDIPSTDTSPQDSKDSSDTSGSVVNDMLSNVGGSVKELEKSMDAGKQKLEESRKKGKLETVVKLADDDKPAADTQKSVESGNRLGILSPTENENLTSVQQEEPASNSIAKTIIDSENNRYVLSRTNDPSAHTGDLKLFHDIVMLTCSGFIFGLVFDFFGMPSFFGFITAGIVLGPSMADKIQDLAQIESISQFGVLLILFVLGLEFSVDTLGSEWRITVVGGSLTILASIIVTTLLGWFLQLSVNVSIFLGATISFSSTAVVIRSLSISDVETSYGRAVLGILVLQDIALGLLLGSLPILAMESNVNGILIIKELALFVARIVLFCIVSWVSGKVVVRIAYHFLKNRETDELKVLGLLSICFMFVSISEYLELSAEVGCFMAGIMITNNLPRALNQNILIQIESLRNFFSCLFFAAIGMHVFPKFLLSQAQLLLVMTLCIMGGKIILGYVVFKGFLKQPGFYSLAISVALCQMSEFAFVLASKAKSYNILVKEAYYLLLGVTILSLVVTPFAIKFVKFLLVRTKYLPLAEDQQLSTVSVSPVGRPVRMMFRSSPAASTAASLKASFNLSASSVSETKQF